MHFRLRIKLRKIKAEFDVQNVLRIKLSKFKGEFDVYLRLHIKRHYFLRPFDVQRQSGRPDKEKE